MYIVIITYYVELQFYLTRLQKFKANKTKGLFLYTVDCLSGGITEP